MIDIVYDPPTRNKVKPLRWIVIDSMIIAGIAFLATLPVDRLPTVFDIYIAVKAFLYSFLMQLAVERGLKRLLANRGNSE